MRPSDHGERDGAASATSSTSESATGANPPIRSVRGIAMHCPLARSRSDPRWSPLGGPKRYTSVVSIEAWSHLVGPVGQSNRPATVSRSSPSAEAWAASASGSRGSGRGVGVEEHHPLRAGGVEALLQRPRLAGPADGSWATPDDGCARCRCDRGRTVARLVVDDDDLGNARPRQAFEEGSDAGRLVTSGDDHRRRRGGPAISAVR